MNLKDLSSGKISGTGTVEVAGGKLGGVLISTDGTNAAAVIVRRDNSSGKKIFDLSTKTPIMITAPISTEGTTTVYYDISGTGASAELFEWVD